MFTHTACRFQNAQGQASYLGAVVAPPEGSLTYGAVMDFFATLKLTLGHTQYIYIHVCVYLYGKYSLHLYSYIYIISLSPNRSVKIVIKCNEQDVFPLATSILMSVGASYAKHLKTNTFCKNCSCMRSFCKEGERKGSALAAKQDQISTKEEPVDSGNLRILSTQCHLIHFCKRL